VRNVNTNSIQVINIKLRFEKQNGRVGLENHSSPFNKEYIMMASVVE
jgi:hypothetical protein